MGETCSELIDVWLWGLFVINNNHVTSSVLIIYLELKCACIMILRTLEIINYNNNELKLCGTFKKHSYTVLYKFKMQEIKSKQ